MAADQATKSLALSVLDEGPVQVVRGLVTFRLTFNSGGAFGLLQGLPGLFLFTTLVVIAVILLWSRRVEGAASVVPLGLILGGGVGNLLDRVARGYGGRVVDFIDVGFWPVFNLADAAIVVGAGLVVALGARRSRSTEPAEPGERVGAANRGGAAGA